MSISIVLADAQPIVLEGLKSVLRRARRFRIKSQCTTSEQTLRAVRKHRPDILVLDVYLSSKNAFGILRTMARAKLPTRSVVFTAALSARQTLELIRLGVSGTVLKEVRPGLLVKCLRKVSAGENCFEEGSGVSAVERLRRRQTAIRHTYENLTQRQRQIVGMVAKGLRNNQIARRLSITEGTVQVHLHDIYKKLNLRHRLALALYARDIGLSSNTPLLTSLY